MKFIKSLHIVGLKKFKEIKVDEFNPHINILVGENEAGKSTILEAIKIVLNQQYKNADKSVLIELFNRDMVMEFLSNPSVETLPHIYIELKIDIGYKDRGSEFFYGEVNIAKKEAFGITFECKFDDSFCDSLAKEIREGMIPYEYYTLRWTTFGGLPFHLAKRPFNFLSIDTSSNNTNSSFNYFNRSLFMSRYDESARMDAKSKFRVELSNAFMKTGLEDIDDLRKFGINDKRVILESVLSVFEGDIALENKGSGTESLIKTQIAFDKNKSNLDVILMEEPENHLSYVTMHKMLAEISARQADSQIIITTHSDLIASRLNLENVLWIEGNRVTSIKDFVKDTAEFFMKADNNNFLQLLFSTKIILVEGASEAILLPKIYFQLTGRSLEMDSVSVISCYGLTFPRYLNIAVSLDKRIAVLTDNDKKQHKIDKAKVFNNKHKLQHIFMGQTLDDWTWEACLYRINTTMLEELIEVKKDAEYKYHGFDYGQVLGKMLNNKADTAYLMSCDGISFDVPQYIKDAITWLKE